MLIQDTKSHIKVAAEIFTFEGQCVTTLFETTETSATSKPLVLEMVDGSEIRRENQLSVI